MVQVTATETGIVTVAKDTATEVVTAEMTDAIATGIADQGITKKSIQDVKMTAAEITGNVMMNMAEEIAKIQEGAGAEEEETQLLPREGHQRQRDAFPYLNASAKHQAGMFMHQVTNSIRPCRLSKPVSSIRHFRHCMIAQSPTTGLFNLPGANRTQIPPILGIAGLPPPVPVQTFGMGVGSNPNLSRQSRRLYIGSITPEVNEQNLADFFNKKMAEMNIGTGGSGNPVLAVQCNYEKNYAFVEVRQLVPMKTLF